MLFIIYVIIVFFLFSIYFLSENNTILRNKYNRIFLFTSSSLISLYITWATDINFIDRIRYNKRFFYIAENSIINSMEVLGYEPLFILIVKLISLIAVEPIYYYLLLHFIFLIILFKGLNLIFNKEYGLLVFLILLNYPFFYGYTLNGLRQSFALASIILSIGYMIKNYNRRFIITSIIAVLFHYGTLPFSIALIVIHYIKKIKVSNLLIVYFILSIFFILNLQPLIFSSINIDFFGSYFDEVNVGYYGGGNKIQFYLFNTFFLILFIYLCKCKLYKNDYYYQSLLKVYITFSNIFLLLGFIAYSNRIASYSWFIIPLIIGYLILNIKNNGIRFLILTLIIIFGLVVSFPYHILK